MVKMGVSNVSPCILSVSLPKFPLNMQAHITLVMFYIYITLKQFIDEIRIFEMPDLLYSLLHLHPLRGYTCSVLITSIRRALHPYKPEIFQVFLFATAKVVSFTPIIFLIAFTCLPYYIRTSYPRDPYHRLCSLEMPCTFERSKMFIRMDFHYRLNLTYVRT